MVKQILKTSCYKVVIFALRLLLIYMLAHVFTPNDFGAYSVISTTYTILMLLCGLNLSTYVSRIVPGQELTQRLQVFKTTFLFEVGFTVILVFIFIGSGLIRPTIAIFKISAYQEAFTVGLILLIATMALTEVTNYLWAKIKIAHCNMTDFIAQALWIVPLLMMWYAGIHITVVGVLLVNAIGVVLGVLYGFLQVEIKAWWHTRFNFKILRESLAYSVPLIIPAVSVTAFRFGDRFLLAYYHNLHDVGVYSFAFTFLNTLYTFSAAVIFSNIMPYIVQAHNLNNLARRNSLLLNALTSSVIIFIGAAIVLILFSKPIVGLIARPEYLTARDVLPLLAIGTLNLILNYPGHTIIFLQNRTMLLMWIDLLCFGIGICLAFALIPRFSYYGAAWAFAITFGCAATIKMFYAKIWREISLKDLLFWCPPWFFKRASGERQNTIDSSIPPSPVELSLQITSNSDPSNNSQTNHNFPGSEH